MNADLRDRVKGFLKLIDTCCGNHFVPAEQLIIESAEQDVATTASSIQDKTKLLKSYQIKVMQQYSRAYHNMDDPPVDLKEAYDWLLQDDHTDNDDLNNYDTWARYLRKIKSIFGADAFDSLLNRTQSARSVISLQEANYDPRLHDHITD